MTIKDNLSRKTTLLNILCDADMRTIRPYIRMMARGLEITTIYAEVLKKDQFLFRELESEGTL